jgi:hypothetical protein
VHHPAKSDKATKRYGRGSGALHGAVDFVYFVEQPDEEKPLQLNFYMEKARGCQKQTPRGFILTKCKIDVAEGAADAVLAMQSDRPAPDFSEYLGELTPRPYDSTPRDETLVLIPVALPMFDTAAGQAARAAVKGAKDESGLKGEEKAVFAALEQLQDQEDKPNGYAQSEIIKVSGPGGGRRPALKALAERGVLAYGKDREGRLLNGKDGRGLQYRIPTGPDDHEEAPWAATDEDLE